MGYIFAASIFDIFHFMPFTDIAQLVLFWLGLNYMREFSPLFGKASRGCSRESVSMCCP